VTGPDQLRILPGVGAALATLRIQVPELRIAVVTNQRGIARGLMSADTLEAIHARLRDDLARDGASVDRIDVCPHEVGTCDCRKPGLGLFEKGLAAWPGVDVSRTAVVGDSAIDIIAGVRLGSRTYLVGEPERRAHEMAIAAVDGATPDEEAASLPALVDDGRLGSWLRDGIA
jgi:D-glycero-D-manno-heptose 1,7-bisphosphate phosphatase